MTVLPKYNSGIIEHEADQITITCYFDPLCCWSWAMHLQLQKYILTKNRFAIELCLPGMIANWNSFEDPLNAINRPSQMGPMWLDAADKTGLPLNADTWVNNPPESSFPACIAVKTAGLQSPAAANSYLLEISKALMINGKNISDKKVIKDEARNLGKKEPALFDAETFYKQFNGEQSREALRADIRKQRYHQVTRFPTLTVSSPAKKGLMIVGYRPYEVLAEILSTFEFQR